MRCACVNAHCAFGAYRIMRFVLDILFRASVVFNLFCTLRYATCRARGTRFTICYARACRTVNCIKNIVLNALIAYFSGFRRICRACFVKISFIRAFSLRLNRLLTVCCVSCVTHVAVW